MNQLYYFKCNNFIYGFKYPSWILNGPIILIELVKSILFFKKWLVIEKYHLVYIDVTLKKDTFVAIRVNPSIRKST